MRARTIWTALLILAGAVAFSPGEWGIGQDRGDIDARPSAAHLLGTDELGRDRAQRVLRGTAISMLLAPAAALLATAIGAVAGCFAGLAGGALERSIMSGLDVFVSLPWLFVLLTARALLPLNLSPGISVGITFLLLGLLGWPVCARMVRARIREARESDYCLQAMASGVPPLRLVRRHLLPNAGPVLSAQFQLAVPIFILAEANLALLGLGVSEPMPSWGNLLRELEDAHGIPGHPERLAALALLVAVLTLLQQPFREKAI